LSLYLYPSFDNKAFKRMNDIHRTESGSSVTILHTLKALETRRQWPNRLKVVFTSQALQTILTSI
jgi:hypothetical protein